MHENQRTISFIILIAGLNMYRSNTPNGWLMPGWNHPSAASTTPMTTRLLKR